MKTATRFRSICTRGYTAVEVLVSIAVFSIGASGVIAMQRASVQGNYDARTLDVANSIARTWQDRLLSDAKLWTVPQTPPPNTTRWLQFASNAPVWATPAYPTTGTPEGLSPAFGLLGEALTSAVATDPNQGATFCVQLRLTTLSTTVVRSEVRVMWLRGGGQFMCNVGTGLDPATNPQLRELTTTSIVRGSFGGGL